MNTRIDKFGKSFIIVAIVFFASNMAFSMTEFKLTASDARENDHFGQYVAINGETLVVGVNKNDSVGIDSGAVFVYRFNGSEWKEEAKLIASDAAEGDWFGYPVCINNNIIVVGASRNDDSGSDSGSAYVFRFDGNSWIEEAKLIPNDGAENDHFGNAVSVFGNKVVIGASGDSDQGYLTGSAYVFSYDGSGWIQEAKLIASDAAEADAFGGQLSMGDNVVAIGAQYDDDYGDRTGSVYVFRYNGNVWVEETKLVASDAQDYANFGCSISISNQVLVVGADQDGDNHKGAAYVFRYNGSFWNEEVKLTASDGDDLDNFGRHVSIDGDKIAIGANYADIVYGGDGAAYLFQYDNTSWVEKIKLSASDPTAGAMFGIVSISGNNLAVGARSDSQEGFRAGATYVYVPEVTLLQSDTFESGMGAWSNVSAGDNKDWTRDANGTPSSGTGPATGANGSAYYVYLETSSGFAFTAGDTAMLESPSITAPNIQLEFQYHMYGADIGTLAVDVLTSGSWIHDVWSISGQQQPSNSDAYTFINIDLSAYDVSKIRFRATANGGYRGDIAIDNVEILSIPSGPVAPVFLNDPLAKPDAFQDQPYSDSLAADASDANGDPLFFSKISGPAWLNIAPNGDLSGVPTSSDVGSNSFTVGVSDGDLSNGATLNINVNDNSTPVLLSSNDFELLFGDWRNVGSGDAHDWTRDSNGTPSSGTGPATGANGSTYYVYLETSSGSAYTVGNTAILEGPSISATDIHLKFQYHMYGSNIGTLAVDVLTGGSWLNDVWSISGQQHSSNSAAYASADVNLSAYDVSRVRFRATAVGGYRGDIALDNVELWRIPSVPVAPVFLNDPLPKSDAYQDQPYSDSIAADASDDNGDPLVFSKISGPAWLNIAPDGDLSGAPTSSDVGNNSFTVEVSDGDLSCSQKFTNSITT